MRPLLDRLLILSLFLLLMGSFASLSFGAELYEDSLATTSTHLDLTIVEFLIYFGWLVLLVRSYRQIAPSIRPARRLLLVCFVCMASCAWSVDPLLTIRRAAVLFVTTIIGIYLGRRYSLRGLQRVVLHALLLLAVLSLVAFLVYPGAVLDPSHPGTFRGLTEHKNYFGEFMSILLLTACTYPYPPLSFLLRGALVIVTLLLLVWAHSATAIVSLLLAMLLIPGLYLMRFRKSQALPAVALICGFQALILLVGSNYQDQLLAFGGKDRTLTGRSEVWDLVWGSILRKPLFGYGYDAFWESRQVESSRIVSQLGWHVAHSHNGYLEALLSIGLVGCSVLLFVLIVSLRDASAYVGAKRTLDSFWPGALLLFFLIHSTGEADLLKRDGFCYLLVVAVSTSLSIWKREHSGHASEDLAAVRSSQLPASSPPLLS